MTSLAIILVLGSALTHSIRDSFTKNSKDKQVFVWWLAVVSFILFAPIAIITITRETVSLEAVAFSFGMSFVHFLYWIFYSKAYEHGDLSHVYPIIRSSPAFVLIAAIIFLNENVSITGVIGILLTTLGLYTINLKKISPKALLEPLQSSKDHHVRFAFLALAMVVAYSTLDKVGVSLVHPFIYVFLLDIGAIGLYTLYIKKTKSKKQWLRPWRKNRKNIFGAAVCTTISYPLVLVAITFTNVSYVSAFRQISVVLVVLIGYLFFKEKHALIRFISAGIIFLGALLVSLA